MSSRKDGAKGLLVGAGLALGLGWLWFPWLAAVWQPHVAWGRVGSGGGGTALLLLLALGFPLGAAAAGRLVAGAEGNGRLPALLRRHARRLCHGAAFLVLLLSLFFSLGGPAVLPGLWPYLIVPAAAAAYVVVGVYWGGRLVVLPAAMAPAAWCVAVLVATAMGWTISFLPPRNQFIVYPLGIVVAWVLAESLARLEKSRPNGRKQPAPQVPESESGPPGIWPGLALLFAAVGYAGGLHAGAPAVSPAWLLGLPFGLGACLPAVVAGISGHRHERALLASAALCVPAAALFLFFRPFAANAVLAAAEGFLSGAALIPLAGAVDRKRAVRRAGLALGACVLLMNLGCWLGGMLAARATLALAILPALAGGLLLLLPLAALFLRERRQGAPGGNNPAPASASAGQTEPSPTRANPFTEEEQRLVALLSMPDLSNQDIADRLFISRDTVRYHLKKLYAKTNTANRAELVRAAASHLDLSRDSADSD